MFCPNCKKEMEDGVLSCKYCGALVTPAAASVSVLSKDAFLKTAASEETKHIHKATPFIVIGCIVSVIISLCVTLFGQVYDLPFIEMLLGTNGIAELENHHSYARTKLTDIDDIYVEFQSVLEPGNDAQAMEIFNDATSFVESPSIYNLNSFISHYDDDEMSTVFSTFITVIFVLALIISAITLFAGLYKKTSFIVLAFLLAFLFSALLSGITYLAVVTVMYAALIVCTAKINHDYRTYKKAQIN